VGWGGVVSGDDHAADAGLVAGFPAGSRVAGYRLEERIGQGGMAVVFRARDEQLGRLVALKILAPALAGDAAFRRRFISESRAAAKIDHPHIVPVFAAGEADGILFIAMRYVAGGDAHSLLDRRLKNREGPLPPGRAAAIISPVASALDAAHRAGLVHRDVKPSNMLMDVEPDRPDHVYLSDFGLAKAVAATSGITGTRTVMGTLDYMSPEQIAGKPVDGRADQYALACSAFELLAGEPPFRRDGWEAMMFAQVSEPPPRLTSLRPGLPPAVDGVLSRALAKAPGDRYASCGQFADALRDALGLPAYRPDPAVLARSADPPTETDVLSLVPETGDAPPTETSIPTRPDGTTPRVEVPVDRGGEQAEPRWRRWRWRIGAAAVIMAAAGLVAWLLWPPGPVKPAVPISVKSALATVTGDVYVWYLGGTNAHAEVYGQIRKAANGEVAELYAQQFPFTSAPALVGSAILHPAGSTARYQFQVTPVLATRYRVEVFQSSTAPTPLATSGTATIYVVDSWTAGNAQTCSRPVCHESFQITLMVPPSALQTEVSKPVYLYFGLNLAPTTEPPAPKWVLLGAGDGHVTAPRRISGDEYAYTITLSFQIGNDAYDWAWASCAKDTEAEDGVGLPGQHGCGDARVLEAASYLG
jgi:serine/threonine protein kinase